MKCFTARIANGFGRIGSFVESGMTRDYTVGNTGIVSNLDVTGTLEIDPALIQVGIHTFDQPTLSKVVLWNCSVETSPQSLRARLIPTKGEDEALIELQSDFATSMAEGSPGLVQEGLGVYERAMTGRALGLQCRHRLLRLKTGESTVITVTSKTGQLLGQPIGFDKLVDIRLSFDGVNVNIEQENERPGEAEFSVSDLLDGLLTWLTLLFACVYVGVMLMILDHKFSLPVLLWSLTIGATIAGALTLVKAIALLATRHRFKKSSRPVEDG